MTPGYYLHIKSNDQYELLYDNANMEDNLDPVVVYRSSNDGRVWVRPYDEFVAKFRRDSFQFLRHRRMHCNQYMVATKPQDGFLSTWACTVCDHEEIA